MLNSQCLWTPALHVGTSLSSPRPPAARASHQTKTGTYPASWGRGKPTLECSRKGPCSWTLVKMPGVEDFTRTHAVTSPSLPLLLRVPLPFAAQLWRYPVPVPSHSDPISRNLLPISVSATLQLGLAHPMPRNISSGAASYISMLATRSVPSQGVLPYWSWSCLPLARELQTFSSGT